MKNQKNPTPKIKALIQTSPAVHSSKIILSQDVYNEREYVEMLEKGISQYENGQYVSWEKGETAEEFLNRITCL